MTAISPSSLRSLRSLRENGSGARDAGSSTETMMIAAAYPVPFALAPPFPGDWHTLSPQAAALLIARLSELRVGAADAAVDAIRVLALRFYPGWMLCDLQIAVPEGEAGRGETMSCLYGPDGCTPLTGDAMRIHGHNTLHGVDLQSRESRLDYLRFFCLFVRGESGPFQIVDGSDQLWHQPDGAWSLVEPDLHPSPEEDQGREDANDYLFGAAVYYGRTLFRTRFCVERSGNVRMVEDDILLSDVTTRPDLRYDGSMRHIAEQG